MNDQPDPNNPESVERTMLDPAERISVTTPMPQPIDDLHEAPAPSPVMTETVAATEPVVATEPLRPRGPAPLSLVLGVLLLAASVVLALQATVDLRVDWSVAGPIALVGGGVVLALAGLVGMRRR